MSITDLYNYKDAYKVYNDPGSPPYLSLTENNTSSDAYASFLKAKGTVAHQ